MTALLLSPWSRSEVENQFGEGLRWDPAEAQDGYSWASPHTRLGDSVTGPGPGTQHHLSRLCLNSQTVPLPALQ